MNPGASGSHVLVWILPLFVLGCIGVSALLSVFGGWNDLASRFAATSAIDGYKFRFTSMLLGSGLFPANYGNCLFVTVGRSGIALSVLFLFRVFHPPLFIPWSAIETVKPEKFWFMTYTAVYVRGFKKRILFTPRVGETLLEIFNAQRKTTSA